MYPSPSIVMYGRQSFYSLLGDIMRGYRGSIIHLGISVIYFNPFDEIIEELFCQMIDNLNLYSI